MLLGFPKRTLIIAGVLVVVGFLTLSGGLEKVLSSFKSGPCQFTVSADVLNVRALPSTKAPVVDTLSDGEELSAYPAVKNGFRMLSETKWAADKFLTKVPGTICVIPAPKS